LLLEAEAPEPPPSTPYCSFSFPPFAPCSTSL
jgi:hypothetical protein